MQRGQGDTDEPSQRISSERLLSEAIWSLRLCSLRQGVVKSTTWYSKHIRMAGKVCLHRQGVLTSNAWHPGRARAAGETKHEFDAQSPIEKHVRPGKRIFPETMQRGILCIRNSYKSPYAGDDQSADGQPPRLE